MGTHAQEELTLSTWQNSSGKWTQETQLQLYLGTMPGPAMLSRNQSMYPTFVSQDSISMYDFAVQYGQR